ncbi:MAG TPA: abortive infection family protein [Paludibacter sp.]
MKQTKEVLNRLENQYSNIDYYYTIVEKIEENVDSNPDITIECCKALLEGLSKFILKQIDVSYDALIIDKTDFQPLVKQSMLKLSQYNEDLEIDFINKANKLIVSIGEVRNKRGDISHGKLSPKEFLSDSHFSNLVMNMTDNLLFYILSCFSNIVFKKELEYDDNPDFNEKLDNENDFGYLSYSKALFDQDIEAYKQELLNHLDIEETNIENE